MPEPEQVKIQILEIIRNTQTWIVPKKMSKPDGRLSVL